MAITPLPTPPSTSSPSTFAADADTFIAALPAFVTEANAQAAALTLAATNDTSSSSVAIGLGAKSFTVSPGKSFQPGMYLVIADAAAPSTNGMYGRITSYSGTSLVMNILQVFGSGTKTSWFISQSSPGGASSGANGDITSLSGLTTPLSISQGGTGASIRNSTSTAGTTFTSADQGKMIECITNNAQAHVLPLGSSMPNGGQITFISKTIGNTVTRSGADVINTGSSTPTSVTLNPGTVLRFTWDGTEWKLQIKPSPGFINTYTAADIQLNVGETAYYDVVASTSLALRLASADNQNYEINIDGTGTSNTANRTTLSPNNTTYSSPFTEVGNYTNSTVAPQLTGSQTVFTLAFPGDIRKIRSIVSTKTVSKNIISNGVIFGSGSLYYAMLMNAIWADTTTLWTSLGTITFPLAFTGRVSVKRIT